LELDALEFNFHPSTTSLGVQSIANLLQQVLYGRRGFPFYSFCVVAGIDYCDSDGSGAVYVYDAIGSFERVAVGCSGTGRELLQPVLDRLFSDSSRGVKDNGMECLALDGAHSDVMAIPAVEQRYGVAGSLRPPVRTTVDCTWEEAVRNIARGFQAVSEREISVGDELVICLLRSKGSESTADVINFKLKKH
jgi:20S proteasome subunit beta 6